MESLFANDKPRPVPGWKRLGQSLGRFFSPRRPPAPYHVARWIFLRMLGGVYLCAFVSLWVQLDGLIGTGGILPADRLMELAREQLGGRIHVFPTLLWADASDGFLHSLTAAGTGLSVLLIAGIAPAPVLILLWVLYLSMSLAGQVFFSFQWDTLLLETGFLAIWLAPLTLAPRTERRASVQRPALWLLWWLLFRLMLESGVVKLASGDPTWSSLTALRFHFETQPLPTWIGWYAHQLPDFFLDLAAVVMFVIELVVSFLILVTTRFHRTAFALLMSLQCVIFLTGNYCFFNVLTMALCVLLVDDGGWPYRLQRFAQNPLARPPRNWPGAIVFPVCIAVFLLTLAPTAASLRLDRWSPEILTTAYRWVQPFRTINSYGLFAVMTTARPEIIVEGTADGQDWQPYEFKYKPGSLSRAPSFVAPHQPRLDWQMWFAALGPVEQNPWFLRFLQRLLEGSADAAALLETNPFPERPPEAVRAVLYDYRFTNLASSSETGQWWRRENRRDYCPAVRLNADGQMILFEAEPLHDPILPGPELR